MGRRLAVAVKACRARRTRGDTGLRFFFATAFVPEEAVVFRLVGLCLAGVRLAGASFGGVLSTGVAAEDCVNAGCNHPGRINIPTKTATTKHRTQTLPTAGSWH